MEDKQQQRAREHPPQTTLTGSALEGFIREALLSRDHGIWYQFVEDETQPDGTVATKAVSNPIRSQEFLRLYDIHAESDQNIVQKGLSRSDQHLALTARNSAMNPRGEPVACTVTMRDSQSLRPKRVIEMYARRITLPDERVVLASLHSDLASSNEWHGIHSMALEQLNVFIFVKEWHSESQRFLFRYVNAPLAKALGVKSPIHVVGKSDYDYFEKAVADRFQQDDQEVASSKPGFRLVVEEDLPSCRNALRLTTIKTQYERFAPRSGITGGTMVLGMSFDITPVTGVLREVINQSQDAVYIKDAAMRYTAVNARFLELLNLNRGVDIRHHTFSEALNHLSVEERSKYYTPTELSALKAKIEKEDKALLDQPNGTHKSVVRRAINGTECLTRKSLVSFEGQKHIIGVTRSLFSGVSTQFFEKASQSICVKDHNLRIVWCNRSYAKRHRKSEQQIIGLQDTDLWPDEIFGDQAKRYQDKDRRVLAIGKRIHASQKHHGGRSAEATWKSLISQLRRNKCYEFRETQRINKRTERILQTTKWPEFIEGKWYVVVVYSDVTEGDSKIVEYHRSTVHTLRSILYPIDAACDIRAFHACRAFNGIEPYQKQGIRKLSRDLLRELAHSVFSGHRSAAAIDAAVNEADIPHFEQSVYLFTDSLRPLDRSCSHYLQSGSEMLQALSIALGVHSVGILASQGLPYLVECEVPIVHVSDAFRHELWRTFVTKYFRIAAGSARPKEPFDFCIRVTESIVPEAIKGFHRVDGPIYSTAPWH